MIKIIRLAKKYKFIELKKRKKVYNKKTYYNHLALDT